MRTLLLTLTTCLFVLPAYAKYSGGSGTVQDPYQIATAADLIALGETPGDYDKHFLLTADIDLDPKLPGRKVFDKAVIAPNRGPVNVSFQGPGFAGVFDGKGHVISHLTVSGQDYVGLFGGLGQYPARGEVKNLGLVDVNIPRSNAYVGGLVGENSYSSTVTECYSTGAVNGSRDVAGLVGVNSGTVTQCYSTAAVSGTSSVGGLVGTNNGGGDLGSAVTQCYSTGAVRGSNSVGGLVGDNNFGDVTQCYSTGKVSGYESVGGLVGENRGAVTQCYSSAPVIGGNWVGGLVGGNDEYDGNVTQCYSTGAVSGTGYNVGGLVGGNMGPVTVTSSRWDTRTSGQARSAGGTGKTTAQMQSIETYLEAGWDFVGETKNGTHEVWQMPQGGGYPVLGVFHGYAPPQLKGAGTAENPYLIHDALELGALVHYSAAAHYRLAASIDLSGIRWGVPVIPTFAGTLDGNGHTISHLTIQGAEYLGLLGRLVSGAEVRGLGVVDVNVTGSGSSVGALAGENWGAVTQCYSTGTVSGMESVGGLVGWLQWGGTMTQCYSTGAVSGTGQCVGGLVGSNGIFELGSGTVTGCHSSGSVSGTSSVGGLVGSNWGTVAASYSASAVSGKVNVGGLVGLNAETISDSRAMGTVAGGSFVGGLAGTNGFIVTVSDTKAAFVCPGSIFNSYAAGSVNGDKYAGGLVGANREGTLVHCYCTAAVRGNESVGGLVGEAWNRTSTAACFWDAQTSGQTASAGGTGKTTGEMQTAKTFLDAGWDFVGETTNGTEDIWWILEGKDYPHLWWEAAPK